jgi:hypothetical protein
MMARSHSVRVERRWWTLHASSIWAPTRNEGLREATGLCNTREISRPRSERISLSFNDIRSRLLKRMVPSAFPPFR